VSKNKTKVTAVGVASFGKGDNPLVLKGEALVYGGPATFSLGSVKPFQIQEIWDQISETLDDTFGVTLPTIEKGAPWGELFQTDIYPALWLEPVESGDSNVFLQLTFAEPVHIGLGGSMGSIGPVKITVEPEFDVNSIMVGYDKVGGLSISASVTMPTKTGAADDDNDTPKAGKVTKIVKYPFPLPEQKSNSSFKIHYLGLGQRVGPKPITDTSVSDPLKTIFDDIECNFNTNDPATMLTRLAKDFYDPKLGWFIAADVSILTFRIRVLFNDPSMYGLEITVDPDPNGTPNFLDGLRFEILYQKLGPNLGVYFAAVDLPTAMRKVPVSPFVLTLPGFSLWLYTNGDFRINVGWPIGKNSIGITWSILTGWIGFYFAKLRSGDNPGASASDKFNPILALGVAFRLEAAVSISAGVFSASLSISVTVVFQGLLAWKDGSTVTKAPDAYWFAGTLEAQVLVKGAVDFKVIKVSVSISFSFKADIAMENEYGTDLIINAQITARATVKVVFFKVHFSFHTEINHTIHLNSGSTGEIASVNGPRGRVGGEDELTGIIGEEQVNLNTLMLRSSMVRRDLAPLMRHPQDHLAPPRRLSPERRSAGRVMAVAPSANFTAKAEVVEKPVTVEVKFALQGTAVYSETADSAFGAIGMLLLKGRDHDSDVTEDLKTDFELLVSHLVCWLLNNTTNANHADDPLSERLKALFDALQNTEALAFRPQIDAYFDQEVTFIITGVDGSKNPNEDADPDDDPTWTLLPMFDVLTMKIGDTTRNFQTFNPLPPEYGDAVDLYFEGLSLFGDKPEAPPTLMETAGPDSMARFLYSDYYLMLSQHVVSDLYKQAVAYETKAKADLASGGSGDESSAVNAHVLATDDQSELDYLLDNYDYASASGFVSRALAGGQQLLIPEQVTANAPVTAKNVHNIAVDGIYALSGQQVNVAATGDIQTLQASLELPTGDDAPTWLVLTPTGEGDTLISTLPLPKTVPVRPAPTWNGTDLTMIPADLKPAGDAGTLTLKDVDPIASVGLKLSSRGQTVWKVTDDRKLAIVPLPAPLQALVDGPSVFDVALTLAQDPSTGTPAVNVDGLTGLVFDIPINQVTSQSLTAPSGESGSAVVPNLYQIWATDDIARDLIRNVLDRDAGGQKPVITLLYLDGDGKTMKSDTLDDTTLLSRSNLSTQNQAKPSPVLLNAMALQDVETSGDNLDPAFAQISGDPLGFLRLIWEVSVVNATGFYLHYRTLETGEGLPASVFAQTGTDEKGQSTEIEGTSGAAASIRVLVTFSDHANNQLTLPKGTNCVVAKDFVGKTASIAVFNSDGTPVPSWHSRIGAGELGFRLDWTDQNITDPNIGDVNAAALYSLLQYNVHGMDDVWSLPLSPIQDDAPETNDLAGSGAGGPTQAPLLLAQTGVQTYQQVFPAYRFLDQVRALDGDENVYALVGQTVTLNFRLADLFGNDLGVQAKATQQGFYHDALINVSQWPMVQAGHYFRTPTDASTDKALLVICLSFDVSALDILISPDPSDTTSDPQAQLAALAQKYDLILDQLTDPGTQYSMTTSLLANGTHTIDVQAELLAFAQQIRTLIEEHHSGAVTVGANGVPAPITQALSADVPFTSIDALAQNIFAIEASIGCSRNDHLWPDIETKIPEAKESISQIAPRRSVPIKGDDLCAQETNDDAGEQTYAQAFEAAFKNFNTQGGMLKTAERAGQESDAQSDKIRTLWAVRFAGRKTDSAGVSMTYDADSITYFALPPLNTDPVNQVVDKVTYNGIDMDAWSRDCFRNIDRLFEPELSVAIAVLEARMKPATSAAAVLSNAKGNIAKGVPLTLENVYQIAPEGDIKDAQEQLEQAMLTRLSAAYDVSTLMQVPAKVTVRNSTGEISEKGALPPEFFGRVGPLLTDAKTGDTSKVYDLSAGRLTLENGKRWSTVLVSVTDQQAQSDLSLDLEYNITALQHDFDTSDNFDGYTPSSWLNFVIPGDMLNTPISTKPVSIPIPLPFEPQAPMLTRQQAYGTKPDWTPSTGISKLIEEALKWTYATGMNISGGLAGQDQLYFDAIFGIGGVPPRNSQDLPSKPINTILFEQMAHFRGEWASFKPLIPQIIDAANADKLPANAPDLMEALQAIAKRVNDVADAWTPSAMMMRMFVEQAPEIIHYRIQMERDPDDETLLDVTLGGWTESPDSSQMEPGRWPTLTFEPQTGGNKIEPWVPNTDKVTKDESSIWWEITAKLPAGDVTKISVPQNFTLMWDDLSLSNRQLARLRSWIVRNAELVKGIKVHPNFIYETEEVSFASAAVPMIQRTDLETVIIYPDDPDLQEILTQILTPLDFSDEGLDPFIRLNADLAYELVNVPSSTPLEATIPLILQPNLVLSSTAGGVTPEVAAKALTSAIRAGFETFVGRDGTVYLDLSITLFGSEAGQQVPLIVIDPLRLDVTNVPKAWWAAKG
jgi:hypothetical protein